MLFFRKHKKIKKYLSIAVSVLVVLQMAAPALLAPRAAQAQTPGDTESGEAAIFSGDASFFNTEQQEKIAEKIEKTFEEKLVRALTISAMLAIRNAAVVATRMAGEVVGNLVVNGNTGHEPGFYAKAWTKFVKDYTDYITGSMMQEIQQLVWETLGIDICNPGIDVKLGFQLWKLEDSEPHADCGWKELAKNYKGLYDRNANRLDSAYKTVRDIGRGGEEARLALAKTYLFLKSNVDVSYSKDTSQIGAVLSLEDTLNRRVARETYGAERQRSEDQGAISLKNLIGETIKTPAFLSRGYLMSENDAIIKSTYDEAQLATAVAADIPDAIASAFLTTFLSQTFKNLLIKLLMVKGYVQDVPNVTANISNYSLGVFSLGQQDNAQVLESEFAAARNVSFNYSTKQVDLLTEFTVCNRPRHINNCVMDQNFAQAVRQATQNKPLTLKQAIDGGYINGSMRFINGADPINREDDCYQKGYCYSNLVKMRKARIIPVGWEIAAGKVQSQQNDNATLLQIMNDFDNEGSRFYRLIDPNWILLYPQNQCKYSVPGPMLQADGGSERKETCVDMQDCVAVKPNGECAAWGYCAAERNTFNFGGTPCPGVYDSCRIVQTTDKSQKAAYLLNTVDRSVCDAGNAGCRWYALNMNHPPAADAQFDWGFDLAQCSDGLNNDGDAAWDYGYDNGCSSRDDNNEVDDAADDMALHNNWFGNWMILNKNVNNFTCSAADEGCSTFIRAGSQWGNNLLANGGFEGVQHTYFTDTAGQIYEQQLFYPWGCRSEACGLQNGQVALDINEEAQVFAGKYSVTLHDDSQGGGYVVSKVSANISLAPKQYKRYFVFSGYVKKDVPAGNVKFNIVPDNISEKNKLFHTGTDAGLLPVDLGVAVWQRVYEVWEFSPKVNGNVREVLQSILFEVQRQGDDVTIDNLMVQELLYPSLDIMSAYREYAGADNVLAYVKKAPAYYQCYDTTSAGIYGRPETDVEINLNHGLKRSACSDGSICTGEAECVARNLADTLCQEYTVGTCSISTTQECLIGHSVSGCPAEESCTEPKKVDDKNCDRFAATCTAEDVGCEAYLPTDGGRRVNGVVSYYDYCPADCAGYNSYSRTATYFEEQQFPVYLIPKNAVACNAAQAGCEEFTNLNELSAGGEAKHYYSELKHCAKLPEEANLCKPFYTWVGSEVSGYQLQAYSLVYENDTPGFKPKYNLAYSLDEQENLCNASVFESRANPDCRQFYDENGHVSYRLQSKTITCSEACEPLRRTEKYADAATKGLTRDECLSRANNSADPDDWSVTNVWNAAEVTCSLSAQEQCEFRHGEWRDGECIFWAIPTESRACTAENAGCREYKGNFAGDEEIVYQDDFGGNSDWQEQLNLFAGENDQRIVTLADGQYLRSDGNLVYLVTNPTTIDILSGRQYNLSFWIKSEINASGSASVNLEPWAFPAVDMGGGGGTPLLDFNINTTVPQDGQWHFVNLDFQIKDTADNKKYAVALTVNGSNSPVYLDKFVLTDRKSYSYLIKNSWTIPAVCDNHFDDTPTAAEPRMTPYAQVGCREYVDRAKQTHYLKSFSSLCPADRVGCEALIDTKNSQMAGAKDFQREIPAAQVCNDVKDLFANVIDILRGNSGNPDAEVWKNYEVTQTSYNASAQKCVYSMSNQDLVNIIYGNSAYGQFGWTVDDERNLNYDLAKACRFINADNIWDGTKCIENVARNSADELIYLVVNEKSVCNGNLAGCTAVGAPKLQATTVGTKPVARADDNRPVYDTQYYRLLADYLEPGSLNPAGLLCNFYESGCNEFTTAEGQTHYFKDPSGKVCVYTEGTDGVRRWYKKPALDNGEYQQCNIEDYYHDNVNHPIKYTDNISDPDVPGNDSYQGWTAECPNQYDKCTAFIDPTDKRYSVPQEDMGKAHYYINDTKLDKQTCTRVSREDGCILVNDTSIVNFADQSWVNTWNSYRTYYASRAEDKAVAPITTSAADNAALSNETATPVLSCSDEEYAAVMDNGWYCGQMEQCLLEHQTELSEQNAKNIMNVVNECLTYLAVQDADPFVGGQQLYCTNLEGEETRLPSDLNVLAARAARNASCTARKLLQNDTNLILKVINTRECAQWYDCIASHAAWNPEKNKYETVCDQLGLCEGLSDDVDSPVCAQWAAEDSVDSLVTYNRRLGEPATHSASVTWYQSRGAGWFDLDYSGMSGRNTYPLQFYTAFDVKTLMQNNDREADNYQPDFRLVNTSQKYYCTSTYDRTGGENKGFIGLDANNCDDGIDNDNDGLIDTADIQCAADDGNEFGDLDQQTCSSVWNNTYHDFNGNGLVGLEKDPLCAQYGNEYGDDSYTCEDFCGVSWRDEPDQNHEYETLCRCYNGFCSKPVGDGTFSGDLSPTLSCRAYPSVDAPFPYSVKPSGTGEKSSIYSRANVISFGEVELVNLGVKQARDYGCYYDELQYGAGSITKYVPAATKDFTQDNLKPAGYCQDEPDKYCECNAPADDPGDDFDQDFSKMNTATMCISTDCATAEGSTYGTCLKIDNTKIVKYRGLRGYCLEQDNSLVLNNDQTQHPCLTWYPSDQLAGIDDFRNNYSSAGFNWDDYFPGEYAYFCQEQKFAMGHFGYEMKANLTSLDFLEDETFPLYSKDHKSFVCLNESIPAAAQCSEWDANKMLGSYLLNPAHFITGCASYDWDQLPFVNTDNTCAMGYTPGRLLKYEATDANLLIATVGGWEENHCKTIKMNIAGNSPKYCDSDEEGACKDEAIAVCKSGSSFNATECANALLSMHVTDFPWVADEIAEMCKDDDHAQLDRLLKEFCCLVNYNNYNGDLPNHAPGLDSFCNALYADDGGNDAVKSCFEGLQTSTFEFGGVSNNYYYYPAKKVSVQLECLRYSEVLDYYSEFFSNERFYGLWEYPVSLSFNDSNEFTKSGMISPICSSGPSFVRANNNYYYDAKAAICSSVLSVKKDKAMVDTQEIYTIKKGQGEICLLDREDHKISVHFAGQDDQQCKFDSLNYNNDLANLSSPYLELYGNSLHNDGMTVGNWFLANKSKWSCGNSTEKEVSYGGSLCMNENQILNVFGSVAAKYNYIDTNTNSANYGDAGDMRVDYKYQKDDSYDELGRINFPLEHTVIAAAILTEDVDPNTGIIRAKAKPYGFSVDNYNGEHHRQFNATARFFAWAGDSSMPIKKVMVNWGDGMLSGQSEGLFKNHKPFCQSQSGQEMGVCYINGTRDETGTCNENTNCGTNGICGQYGGTIENKCYRNAEMVPGYACLNNTDCNGGTCKKYDTKDRFGDTPDACEQSYFQFNHVYTCHSPLSYPSCTTGAYLGVCHGRDDKGIYCQYRPRVMVLDNWGYCNQHRKFEGITYPEIYDWMGSINNEDGDDECAWDSNTIDDYEGYDDAGQWFDSTIRVYAY